MDDELRALKREQERFHFVVEDAKRYFGEWDSCDPVVWAILRVVQAQNDFADAMNQVAAYGVNGRVVEAAIEERRKAIAALREALEREPRGFQ
jgi:tetratricopeptide (TPR) repeat protein